MKEMSSFEVFDNTSSYETIDRKRNPKEVVADAERADVYRSETHELNKDGFEIHTLNFVSAR